MFQKLIKILPWTRIKDYWENFYPISPSEYSPHYFKELTRTEYLKLYTGWIYACTTSIAQTVANQEFVLLNKKWGKEIYHKNLDLLTYDFINNFVSFLVLNGSSFAWKFSLWKNIQSLSILRPDRVSFDQKNWIISKIKYSDDDGVQYKFAPEEIMDIHLFNPLESYPKRIQGVSPVWAVALQMAWDLENIKHMSSFYKRGASVNGVLETEKDLSKEQSEIIKSNWNSQYSWSANSFKTPVLTGWLKYNKVQMNMQELDAVNTRRFTKEEVFTIMKVPEILCWKMDSTTYASAKIAEKMFAKYTIYPIVTQIQESFNKYLFNGIWYLEFINVVPNDMEDLRADLEAWGITINEYRKLRWHPSLDGLDRLKIPWFTLSEWEFTTPTTPTKSIEKDLEFKIKSSIKWTEEYNQKVWEEKIKRNDNYEKDYKNALIKIFEIQKKDILDQVKKWFKVDKPKWNELKYSMLYINLLKWIQLKLFQEEANQALKEINIDEVFIIGESLDKWLIQNIQRIRTSVDQITKEKIAQKIDEGIQQGLWTDEMTRKLESVFTELQTVRINQIVRSETIRAGTQASLEARKDSNIVEYKEWFTALDERVCPHCSPMNGKKIKLDDNFYKKWDKTDTGLFLDYMDVDGSPLHVNCRCTLIPIIQRN